MVEELIAENNPENELDGTRTLPFSKELWIERTDFMEDAPAKYFRLTIGKEVRLKHAYYVTCIKVVKNDVGEVIAVHCNYDPHSKGGWTDDGRKVKGTLHWVSVSHSIKAQINIYNRLFNKENPLDIQDGENFLENLNLNSLKVINSAQLEPNLKNATLNEHYQFVRNGYFVLDKDSNSNNLIFNQSVSLRDSWTKHTK